MRDGRMIYEIDGPATAYIRIQDSSLVYQKLWLISRDKKVLEARLQGILKNIREEVEDNELHYGFIFWRQRHTQIAWNDQLHAYETCLRLVTSPQSETLNRLKSEECGYCFDLDRGERWKP